MLLQLSNNYYLGRDDWQYRAFDNENNRTGLVAADDIPNGMNWMQVWHRLVEEYSLRKFTNQTDRLPTLAVLADGMKTRLKWTYVAGMWAENMPQELLWQHEAWKSAEFGNWDRDKDVEEVEYVAPSWSWASVDFHVRYDTFQLTFGNSIVEILEMNVVPAGSNTKGKLESGCIKIKAKVKLLQARSAAPPMGIQQEKLCRVYMIRLRTG
ncbi:hypothetical protein BKA61DRAFT_717166 [Leptodontidium sp. MPI-SDFR-AT-0119]|nr:hypothetical protein BKA61DRAFT_717166 [Leptodontidium sp. MPI-SDFR-AT-0119]